MCRDLKISHSPIFFGEHKTIDPVPEMDVVELRPWQQEVVDKLDAQNSRQILFVIDTEGGKGKSELAKWLMIHKNAWACQGNYFLFFRGLRPLHPRFFLLRSVMVRRVGRSLRSLASIIPT